MTRNPPIVQVMRDDMPEQNEALNVATQSGLAIYDLHLDRVGEN
jgi:hypothetical protein